MLYIFCINDCLKKFKLLKAFFLFWRFDFRQSSRVECSGSCVTHCLHVHVLSYAGSYEGTNVTFQTLPHSLTLLSKFIVSVSFEFDLSFWWFTKKIFKMNCVQKSNVFLIVIFLVVVESGQPLSEGVISSEQLTMQMSKSDSINF